MKTVVLVLFVSISLAACKNRNHIPNRILKPAKMQAVLWDMVRADQLLNDNILKKDSSLNRVTESIKLYQQVFHIHSISKEKFQQSFSFYRTHPGLLKVILDSLNNKAYNDNYNNAPTEMVQPQTPTVVPIQ